MKKFIAVVAVFGVLVLGFYIKDQYTEIYKEEGISIISKTSNESLLVYKNSKWEEKTIKGVNMGMGKPNYFPGEAAITKSEYFRWFKDIKEMNVDIIRIYTVHPPGFYEALYEYNSNTNHPIYILHGAWVNEDVLHENRDFYHEDNISLFEAEMENIVDIVHGNATIEKKLGHAYGVYDEDISKYVLGYIIGIEWNPEISFETNEKHNGLEDYSGNYFVTKNANACERWMAERMDFIADYETKTYQMQRSLSFTNWVTTDLLKHPYEPSENEDMVSIDPNKITLNPEFKAGYFASYHVYPYYPDLLNFDPVYGSYLDHRNEKNSYAGYLNDLKKHHNIPVLIAEFGIPASRGLTHKNINGKNQGFTTEETQGNQIKNMYQDILTEGLAGGLIFTWQDEWFKRTWNTMEYDNPDQRPFWSNIQVCEQRFGIMSFDPIGFKGKEKFLDGNDSDWSKYKPIYKNKDQYMYIDNNEESLYFKMNYKKDDIYYILIDTIKNQGQKKNILNTGYSSDEGIDYVIKINENGSYVLVDSYYDPFSYHYGDTLKMIEPNPNEQKKDNGQFNLVQLALSKRLLIEPIDLLTEFESYEAGKLKWDKKENTDFLTDIVYNEKDQFIEMRIPWMLMNFRDPSQKEIITDFRKLGGFEGEEVEGLTISVLKINENGKAIELISSPSVYSWENWGEAKYKERLKSSYYILKEYFKDIK